MTRAMIIPSFRIIPAYAGSTLVLDSGNTYR